MLITPWIKATVNQLSREKSRNLGLMERKCGSLVVLTKLANSAQLGPFTENPATPGAFAHSHSRKTNKAFIYYHNRVAPPTRSCLPAVQLTLICEPGTFPFLSTAQCSGFGFSSNDS